MSDASTPLMRQYHGIKQQVPNALLMFRLGDFYELFFEDAVIAARELEITLTARNKEKGAAIPMCGVPYHAAEGYIARLIQKGYRVAICDQMEDPRSAKKLVKREITRIVTPGTAMDATLVRSHENNYLAAVCATERAPASRMSTSPPANSASPKWTPPKWPARSNTWARAKSCSPPTCRSSPAKNAPARASSAPNSKTGSSPRLRRPHPARSLPPALARWLRPRQSPRRHRRRRRHPPLPARHPARRPRPPRPPHLLRPRRLHGARRRHRPQSRTGRAPLRRRSRRPKPSSPSSACSIRPSPAWAAACCASACCAPRSTAPKSNSASTRSANSASRPSCAPNCASSSPRILDLERLLAKVTLGSASPRDLLALGRSLEKIPALKRCFDTQQAARLRTLHDRLDELADVTQPHPRCHRR